jgi:hypothetical protein
MRYLLGSALLLATLGGSSQPAQAKEKKLKEPAPTYFNTRSFQSSCDAIWSAAMPLLTGVGLAPQSMDRQAGVASLRWAKGQNVGLGGKEDVKRFTTGHSGSWASYEVFRIETGTLLATQESIGCRVQLKLSFTALQRNALTGDQWHALESNNFLEQTLLDMIGQLALRNPGATQSVVGSTAKKPPVVPEAVIPTAVPPTKSPSAVETVSQPATVVQVTPPAIKTDHLKIVCSDRFSEVPFSSSRPDRRTLACGEEVTIVSQSGQWTRVMTKDGVEGNVATRFVGK